MDLIEAVLMLIIITVNAIHLKITIQPIIIIISMNHYQIVITKHII